MSDSFFVVMSLDNDVQRAGLRAGGKLEFRLPETEA